MRLEECYPGSCAPTCGCWLNAVGSEDVANGGVADVVTKVRECTANMIVALDWLLFHELDGQIDDHLSDPWPTRSLVFAIRVIPFSDNQKMMPRENRIRREQRANFFESLATDRLALDHEAAPLVIRQ